MEKYKENWPILTLQDSAKWCRNLYALAWIPSENFEEKGKNSLETNCCLSYLFTYCGKNIYNISWSPIRYDRMVNLLFCFNLIIWPKTNIQIRVDLISYQIWSGFWWIFLILKIIDGHPIWDLLIVSVSNTPVKTTASFASTMFFSSDDPSWIHEK